MCSYDAIVVGCGLTGAVIARYVAERMHKNVLILERRAHIGGNMYDYVNEEGILVHKYGPHTFHTKKKELYDFICRYTDWENYKLTCGAVINGKYTPTPFNFQTIDDFFDREKAKSIKAAISEAFPNQDTATVLELLYHENPLIREYADFLFVNDYSPYTAKQWGVSPDKIDPSVLKRVPLRFNYEIGYFDDEYQVMPRESYCKFFENLLDHKNISLELNTNASSRIKLDQQRNTIFFDGEIYKGNVIYTGAIDELFGTKYGALPYRSLKFQWQTELRQSFQEAPVVAYPQAEGYTRITEYTKLPLQYVGNKTTYAIEYPITYKADEQTEPYYPVLTEESKRLFEKYQEDAAQYASLYVCGRLGEFQYYNMDQALERAIVVCKRIAERDGKV